MYPRSFGRFPVYSLSIVHFEDAKIRALLPAPFGFPDGSVK